MKYFYKQLKNKENKILRGVLNTPDDFSEDKKYKTIIMFHGFGGDRNGSSFFRTDNAKFFTKKGYIVFRYDFSGSGESEGDFYDMTLSREIEEANMIYDDIVKQEFVLDNEITLYGHSLGGVISVILAERINVKNLILLAPAVNLNDVNEESEKAKKELISKAYDDGFDIGGKIISYNFLKDAKKYDIYSYAQSFEQNVLILRGEEDIIVNDHCNKKLSKIYKKASYHVIENADHSFRDYYAREKCYELMDEFLK